MRRLRLRSAGIVIAACSLGAVGSGATGWTAAKPVKPKGGLYTGKASVPNTGQQPFARQFQFKVDGGKRRVFNILKSPCVAQGVAYRPDEGSEHADVPSKHPRYGSRISRAGKISAHNKFRDRYRKAIGGEYDQILDFSYRISGRFTSSKRAKGHLSATIKVTTVYPDTTTQVLTNGQPSASDLTCRTGRVSWTVKRGGAGSRDPR